MAQQSFFRYTYCVQAVMLGISSGSGLSQAQANGWRMVSDHLQICCVSEGGNLPVVQASFTSRLCTRLTLLI